ncbi:MAG: histidine kinase [Oscillospiraceae bacterium]|nr:histidine kinase [Oscillospiraceae bacterium]
MTFIMQKSIFAKYFSVCATIILISTTILGAVLLIFVSQYFKQEKYDLLKTNVQKASLYTSKILINYDYNSSLAYISDYYNLYADAIDSVFFLTNTSGTTLYCTEVSPCIHTTYMVPQRILESTKDGEFFESGRLGGIYKESNYTVGIPVYDRDQNIIAYVFSSMPAKTMSSFLGEILKMYIISSGAMLLIAFILVYFITLQMVKPLREMSLAAKRFGQGEFSARIPVTSNDEVGQLAMSLNNMAQSLSILENMRRSFTANVSHELKTPMTSISGFVDGILDGTIPEEKHKQYLLIVSEETKRLSRLVRSMLNLAKIEAGEMQLSYSQFDIVDTICQTVFSFEQIAEQKKLDIRGLDHDKVIIDADPDLIHQVIYNLTENAIKFVNEGGYIEFGFSYEGGKVYISVKNSGAGLTKEEIAHVFERFYKTDKSRGLDKNGVGLGLYIVRTIINLHGGDIIVRSNYGEFCEFVFSLPAKKTTKLVKLKKN